MNCNSLSGPIGFQKWDPLRAKILLSCGEIQLSFNCSKYCSTNQNSGPRNNSTRLYCSVPRHLSTMVVVVVVLMFVCWWCWWWWSIFGGMVYGGCKKTWSVTLWNPGVHKSWVLPVCSKNYFKTEQFSWGSEAFNLHLKYLELKRPTSVHWIVVY